MTSKKLREQGEREKCVAMHAIYLLNFKIALYFSIITITVVLSQKYYCEAKSYPTFKCVATILPTHFYK